MGISPLWFSTLCLYYYAHIHKKSRVGASSVKTDDPNNDKDRSRNNYNSSKPKYNQGQSQKGSQAKLAKESSKGKYTQTGKGKQCCKKLNTLGGYAGQVMVGDQRQPICIPAGTSKVVVGECRINCPRDLTWLRQWKMTIYPVGLV